MKLTIKITKEILEKSYTCGYNPDLVTRKKAPYAENCAIAVAIRELFPDAIVGRDCIEFKNDGLLPYFHTRLPGSARQFIRNFDYSNPFLRLQLPEFSFDIDVPEEIINQIGISEVEEILSKSTTLSKTNEKILAHT